MICGDAARLARGRYHSGGCAALDESSPDPAACSCQHRSSTRRAVKTLVTTLTNGCTKFGMPATAGSGGTCCRSLCSGIGRRRRWRPRAETASAATSDCPPGRRTPVRQQPCDPGTRSSRMGRWPTTSRQDRQRPTVCRRPASTSETLRCRRCGTAGAPTGGSCGAASQTVRLWPRSPGSRPGGCSAALLIRAPRVSARLASWTQHTQCLRWLWESASKNLLAAVTGERVEQIAGNDHVARLGVATTAPREPWSTVPTNNSETAQLNRRGGLPTRRGTTDSGGSGGGCWAVPGFGGRRIRQLPVVGRRRRGGRCLHRLRGLDRDVVGDRRRADQSRFAGDQRPGQDL